MVRLAAMKDRERAYLSICAIYRNEADYIEEWLEFHRLVGVERFFLYNNQSTDNHLEVLAPYIEDGIVVWQDWPMFPGQLEAYQHCVEHHRDASRWIAFIDLDEFLFSPTGRPLPDVLRDFEEYRGVVVNCIFFGTSGHQTPPPGLVVENYTRRAPLDAPRHRIVKSIVDPARTVAIGTVPHFFHYGDRVKAVDENFQDARGEKTEQVSVELLRINHYFTRSKQERRRKITLPRAHSGVLIPSPESAEERDRILEAEADEGLVPYGRAVRAALAERTGGG